jgi:hypothetical protein
VVKQEVLGLYVPVDDALGVDVGKAFSYLEDVPFCLRLRDASPAAEQVGQVFGTQLEHHVAILGVFKGGL